NVAAVLASMTIVSTASIPVNTPTNKRLMPRIAGGSPVTGDGFPYVAYIEAINNKLGGLTCTGSLIAPNVVLTAAHCTFANDVTNFAPGDFQIGFSHTTPDTNKRFKGYSVVDVIPFPSFSMSTMAHDLALLILKVNIPPSVANTTKIFVGDSNTATPIRAAGFGITDPNSDTSVPSQLMAVDLHVGTDKYCLKNSASYEHKFFVCTDGTAGIDTCVGDSGGPLSTPYKNDNGSGHALLGVTSFAPRTANNPEGLCAQAGGSGYYTRASYYINWISSVTNVQVSDLSVNNSTQFTIKVSDPVEDDTTDDTEDVTTDNTEDDTADSELDTLSEDAADDSANDKSGEAKGDGPATSTMFVDGSDTEFVTVIDSNLEANESLDSGSVSVKYHMSF
ncbi:hypothetical protein IW150_006854, partial [Coemansia sp. RSA 2607]